ncbi:MAG: regulatory protein RecX [Sandaracinaceae bacterium]
MSRRAPKPAKEPYLERVALWYLERYGGSEAQLRRVLRKRVWRSVQELDTDPEEGAAAVEAVVAKLIRQGWLDDRKYAESRVRVLRKRGKSARAIRSALRQRGVDSAIIDALLAEGTDDLAAAREVVRRRRLGPFRDDEKRELMRQKDLAKLARAGFSYDIARRALEL